VLERQHGLIQVVRKGEYLPDGRMVKKCASMLTVDNWLSSTICTLKLLNMTSSICAPMQTPHRASHCTKTAPLRKNFSILLPLYTSPDAMQCWPLPPPNLVAREDICATPVLLHIKLTWSLPCIILVAEEHNLSTNNSLDAVDSSDLVLGRRARRAVAVTSVRPSSLHNVHILAGADGLELGDLSLDKGTGTAGDSLGVEESIQVGSGNINDVAECGAAGQPRLDRLGGCDWASVASSADGALDTADESSESRCAAVAVEHSFVSDDEELDEIPLCPVDDVGDLTLCARDTGAGDEDAEDQLQAVAGGCRTDVLQSAAVGAVHTNAGKALARDGGNVARNGACILAATGAGVWRVSHGPSAATVLCA
jgi:hypothetical protein